MCGGGAGGGGAVHVVNFSSPFVLLCISERECQEQCYYSELTQKKIHIFLSPCPLGYLRRRNKKVLGWRSAVTKRVRKHKKNREGKDMFTLIQ